MGSILTMPGGDRWTARYDRAIREGWPSAHGRKPLKTAAEKQQAAKLRMRKLRAKRRAAVEAVLKLLYTPGQDYTASARKLLFSPNNRGLPARRRAAKAEAPE
jgi:hypothetical protein